MYKDSAPLSLYAKSKDGQTHGRANVHAHNDRCHDSSHWCYNFDKPQREMISESDEGPPHSKGSFSQLVVCRLMDAKSEDGQTHGRMSIHAHSDKCHDNNHWHCNYGKPQHEMISESDEGPPHPKGSFSQLVCELIEHSPLNILGCQTKRRCKDT